MKLKITIAFFALLGSTIFASCSKDDNNEPVDTTRTALIIKGGLTTRATDTGWQQGDAIGIYMFHAGTANIAEGVENFRYTASAAGESTTFSPADKENTAYYPAAKAKVDVLAYYPQAAGISGISALPVDVSKQDNLPAIDLMSASATGHSSENAEVAMKFFHRLCKLNIRIEKHSSAANVDLTSAQVVLQNTSPRAHYNLFTGKLENPSAPDDITLQMNTPGTGGTAIVMPTAAGSGVQFSVITNEKTFTAPLYNHLALEAGKEMKLTVKLFEQTAQLEDISVADWEDVTGAGNIDY